MLNRIKHRILLTQYASFNYFEPDINLSIDDALSKIQVADKRLTPDKAVLTFGQCYYGGVYQDKDEPSKLYAVEMYGYNNIPVELVLRNFIAAIATSINYEFNNGKYDISLNEDGQYIAIYQSDEGLSKAIDDYKQVVTFKTGLELNYLGRNFAEAIQKISV